MGRKNKIVILKKVLSKKIQRNSPCPCKSLKKYKNCCLNKENKQSIKEEYFKKYNIVLKDSQQIQGIKECGKLLISILDDVEKIIKPGITTDDINTFVHDQTIKANAIPAPLNYKGFPKSVCVSVNEVICHGVPGKRVLKDKDIVNVDITPILNGYYADASRTFFVGTPTKQGEKIVSIAAQSLQKGIQVVKPGATTGDIGHAIQTFAESYNCSVVREYVGHGTGLKFHEQPQIMHVGRPNQGIPLVQGMVFTIEPMINLGSKELRVLDDKWTVVTLDNSLSAQFEQTILVTHDGWESLTPYRIDKLL